MFWGPKLMQLLALVYRNLARKKLCFVSFFVFAAKIDELGGCQGNTAWALGQ
jgi:hypothetical protein